MTNANHTAKKTARQDAEGENLKERTIETEVLGFTMAPDTIIRDIDRDSALVFGMMWRYCQMSDGVCRKPLRDIAERLGMSVATVIRCAKKLVNGGYLRDLTPKARNVPHLYADTGKVVLKSRLSATVSHRNTLKNDETVSSSNATVSQGNTTVSDRNKTVSVSKLKKEARKQEERKEESPDGSSAAAAGAPEAPRAARATPLSQNHDFYEKTLKRTLSGREEKQLADAEAEYPSEWVRDAILKTAEKADHPGIGYVLGTLKGWREHGDRPREKPKPELRDGRLYYDGFESLIGDDEEWYLGDDGAYHVRHKDIAPKDQPAPMPEAVRELVRRRGISKPVEEPPLAPASEPVTITPYVPPPANLRDRIKASTKAARERQLEDARARKHALAGGT